MSEANEPLVETVSALASALPRCEATGKVIFELGSSGIIAANMTRRSGEPWLAKLCMYCGKAHMWNLNETLA